MLPVQILSGYPYNVEEWEPNPCPYPGGIIPFAERTRRKRSRFYYPHYNNKNDVYNIFRVRYTTCLSELLQCLTLRYSSYTVTFAFS